MTEQEYQEYDEFLSTTRFDVHEIMASKKRFQEVFDLLYGYMKAGFEANDELLQRENYRAVP